MVIIEFKISEKELFKGTVEREIENLYNPLRTTLLSKYPLLSGYVAAKEKEIFPQIDSFLDTAMNLSFPTEETTLEEGRENFKLYAKEVLKEYLVSKNISHELINYVI